MRPLGDDYVKAGRFHSRAIATNLEPMIPTEFRRHRGVTNPVYIMGFLSQWNMYLNQMPSSRDSDFKGKKLDPTVFEKVCTRYI